MGSDCHVILVGARDDAVDLARGEIDRLEGMWSRFIDSSEICALNRGAGHPVSVSPETFELVRLAVEAWSSTSGLFDPTILRALESAGYDRSFEQLRPGAHPGPATPAPGCSAIVFDPDALTIELPSGAAFDPGGIGKGYAVDLVSERMQAEGWARGACVNLGGDLRVWGEPPIGDAWTIGTETARATIAIREGAVATSSRARRRWALAGQTMHHIIDPRTGAPAASDLVAVTVVAGDTWWAEILAKVALISHLDDALRFLKDLDTPALLEGVDGDHRAVCGMEAWLS